MASTPYVSIHCVGRDNAGLPTHPRPVPAEPFGERVDDSEWLVTTFVLGADAAKTGWSRSLFYWRDGKPTAWTLPLGGGTTQRIAGDQYLSVEEATTHPAFEDQGDGHFRYRLVCKRCGFTRVVHDAALQPVLSKLHEHGKREVHLHALATILDLTARPAS